METKYIIIIAGIIILLPLISVFMSMCGYFGKVLAMRIMYKNTKEGNDFFGKKEKE